MVGEAVVNACQFQQGLLIVLERMNREAAAAAWDAGKMIQKEAYGQSST